MAAYPVALTNKAWQKNKGLFAKAKATGIGEALTALEKAFNASGFALDPVQLGGETVDPMPFAQRFEKYGATLQSHAKTIDAAAATVQQKVTAAKSTFAGNKSVLTVLDRLEDDLADFRAALKPKGSITAHQLAAVLAEFKKALHKTNTYGLMVTGGMYETTKKHYEKTLGEVRELERDPRVDKINDLWKDTKASPRSLRTTPRSWDQIMKKEMPKTCAAIRGGEAWSIYNKDLKWINKVGDEPGGTASSKVRTMITGSVTEERAVTQFALEYSQDLMVYRDFVTDLAKLDKVLRKYA